MTNGVQGSSQFLSRKRNYLGSIKKDLKDLQGARALMGELTQNADDAEANTLRFEVAADAFVVSNDGEFRKCDDVTTDVCSWFAAGSNRCDFHSFREVASGDKETRRNTTGAFGIGFTSVYQITDRPELFSSGEYWVLDETAEDNARIERTAGVETNGTIFILPWARSSSAMREAIAQPVVTDESIESLTDELLDVAPELLLFVRHLEWLHIEARDETRSFHGLEDNGVVTISAADGTRRQWLTLRTDLGDTAGELFSKYGSLLDADRSTAIEIVVELEAEPHNGSYFVTLPTEHSTELPVSVNGSFYPKPDRKRIRLGDGHAESLWNEAIIASAAELLASKLAELAESVGDAWVIDLVRKAHDLHIRSVNSVEPIHRVWWTSLAQSLQTAAVVPTQAGSRGTTSSVWLTNGDPEEDAAAHVLAKLGVQLIDPAVRTEWFLLNNVAKVGLRPLRLSTVTAALSAAQATADTPWIAAHLSADERQIVWTVMEQLTKLRSSIESRHEASGLPLVPLADGSIVAPNDAIKVQSGERDILRAGDFQAPTLDDQFAIDYRELAALTPVLSPLRMAELARDAFARGVPDDFDRAKILDWFAARSADALPLGKAWFDRLPIFPTGEGFDTATDLVLPVEGFRSPLRMANVFDTHGRSAIVRQFLVDLGIPSLDLTHFCTEVVPKAVKQGLSPAALNELIVFLASRVSQVKENQEVRRVLRTQPLVPCTDGEVRVSTDTYFGNVDKLVVGDRPVAAKTGGQTVEDLFLWLGVGAKPRPAHVIEHCRTFQSKPQRHAEMAGAVLSHLQTLEREKLDDTYSALQTERWLPVADSTEVATPREVFATFQRYLFSSQAKFIGVGQRVERACAPALRWLGVRDEPTTDLVVGHLIHSAESGEDVNKQVWTYLNQHANEPAIELLRDRPSIHVKGRGYVEPADCFWDPHPFGRLRVLLDHEFRQYQQLFDRIGVRDLPDADDVVRVLGEIASKQAGARTPLLEIDIPIVQACWIFLDELVRAAAVTEEQIAKLRATACVLDAAKSIRRPSDVLYRDSSQIAKQLSPSAAERLIARPDNIKAALDAVGVRHLRHALDTQIVEREDRPDPSEFKPVVGDRRQALARVLDGYIEAPFEVIDAFLDSVDVRALYRLVVIERLDIEGAPDDPAPSERAAYWDEERSELLLVESSARWPEIAREFALALGIEGEAVAQAATPLMNILKAATLDDASAELDDLGYGDVEEAIEAMLDAVPLPPAEGSDEPDDELPPPFEPSVPEDEVDRGNSAAESKDTPPADGKQPLSQEEPAFPPPSVDTAADSTDTIDPRSGSDSSPISSGLAGAKTSSSNRRDHQRPKPRQRLISYVTRTADDFDDAGAGTEAEDDRRSEIDARAVEAVLEFERSQGREPEEMDHSNPGFDIKSREPDGSVRYIEIKGTSPAWDGQGVAISKTQYGMAVSHGEQYWLYVVVVTSDGASEPFRIQDPVSKIDKYAFDGGWAGAADRSVAAGRALPDLDAVNDPSLLTVPVPLLSYADGSGTGEWLECPAQCVGYVDAGLFAVQIAGATLTTRHTGGVAFAVPETDIEDEDAVVVRLLTTVDPETEHALTVRYFASERSDAGELIAARLETTTGVPLMNIDDLSTIQILGRVVHRQVAPA